MFAAIRCSLMCAVRWCSLLFAALLLAWTWSRLLPSPDRAQSSRAIYCPEAVAIAAQVLRDMAHQRTCERCWNHRPYRPRQCAGCNRWVGPGCYPAHVLFAAVFLHGLGRRMSSACSRARTFLCSGPRRPRARPRPPRSRRTETAHGHASGTPRPRPPRSRRTAEAHGSVRCSASQSFLSKSGPQPRPFCAPFCRTARPHAAVSHG